MLLKLLAIFIYMTQTKCEIDRRVITTLKYSKFYIKPFVVNGKPALVGEVPYLVSIKEPTRRLGHGRIVWKNLCGGSIIDEMRVLTAAHCFEGKNFFYARHPKLLRLVAGSFRTDLTHSGRTETNVINQWRTIDRVILHKHFNFPDNDIAIVFVDAQWRFIRNVNFITPARREADYPQTCTSAGFGRTGYSLKDPISPTLLVAPIYVLTRWHCSKLWEMNMNSFVCTDSSVTDMSRGDSGGPLACKNTLDPEEQPGRELLVGVVSGKNFDKTTLYTRVSAYRDWIDNNGSFVLLSNIVVVLITLLLSIYHFF
ncbi:chymotrypsinogen B2-like [Colias croceus]|uniref:chymotrypsinogen B2-like n=1 Tax=Colias crocea TaxID=72248 RepID=UPI001E27BAD5|nr:chymotrypsinogen B2-like [Colias croceus]